MITVELINTWSPCYAPTRHLETGKYYTVDDILNHATIPAADKLWVVLRQEVLPSKTLRLFAVKCARNMSNPNLDQRSINAIDVAERYANGEATEEELGLAEEEALAAARYAIAVGMSTWYAIRCAASAAARDPHYCASWCALYVGQGTEQVEWLKELLK